MNACYVDSLHHGVSTIASILDARWFGMNHPELSEEQRHENEVWYCGVTSAFIALGGDYRRDANGHHRVFLAGLSSRDTDDYKED